jgi:uncharacterized SAM-binding protein YcdF (DUF218 family)
VLIASWQLIATLAARALVVKAELPHADAMVVLSGSANYIERSRGAAELLQSGRADKIILTNDGQRGGWSNQEQRNPLFVERSVEELKRAGVNAVNIEVLPEVVNSTHDEAVLVKEYAVRRHLKNVMIVTSPYHGRRALWTFRKEFEASGLVVGLTFPERTPQTPLPWSWWLTPRGWRLVAGEYVKLVYYRIRFR